MNKTIDLLLKSDVSKLKRPTKDVEITRLSELYGEPFIVTCQALTPSEFNELQETISINVEGNIELDNNIQVLTILKGTKDPDFKSKELMDHFNVPTPKDLVQKIFLSGEISSIYTNITDLSGFSKDSVKEIKNS